MITDKFYTLISLTKQIVCNANENDLNANTTRKCISIAEVITNDFNNFNNLSIETLLKYLDDIHITISLFDTYGNNLSKKINKIRTSDDFKYSSERLEQYNFFVDAIHLYNKLGDNLYHINLMILSSYQKKAQEKEKEAQLDLLIMEICNRLPYGLKIVNKNTGTIFTVDGINPNCQGASFIQATSENGVNIDIKKEQLLCYQLILFPLNTLTPEQKQKIYEATGLYKITEDVELREGMQLCDICNCNYFLNKWHIDYNGLIDCNFAQDATTLNVYQNN